MNNADILALTFGLLTTIIGLAAIYIAIRVGLYRRTIEPGTTALHFFSSSILVRVPSAAHNANQNPVNQLPPHRIRSRTRPSYIDAHNPPHTYRIRDKLNTNALGSGSFDTSFESASLSIRARPRWIPRNIPHSGCFIFALFALKTI